MPGGQERDEQVHRAVGDQPDAGQVGEHRVVGDLARLLDGGVHAVEQGAGGRHPLIVRDRRQVRSG